MNRPIFLTSLAVVAAVIGVIFIVSSGGDPQSSLALSPVQTPPPLISVTEIQREFDANVLTTMDKCEGKYLQLTGQVRKVGQEILGYPYITLKSGENRGVTCRFPTDLTNRVESVSVGERIVITARFNATTFSLNFDRCTFQ